MGLSQPDNHIESKYLQIAAMISAEALRNGTQPPLEGDRLSLEAYKDMCHAMVKEGMLTEGMLQKWLDIIQTNPNLEEHLRGGEKMCLTVLPFSTFGTKMNEEKLQGGAHLSVLILDKNGKVIRGFGDSPSFVAHLLPDEIVENCFSIERLDRDTLAADFQASFRRLEHLLDLSH